MKLYTIDTGFFKLDGGAMYGVVPKSIWNKINPADENNLCPWALRCLLVQEGNRLILIDNGIGDKQDARFFSHYYLYGDDTLDTSLAKHGFTKENITDVFLTHLHFDHCGGSIIRKGEQLLPAFPNATYWSHSRHWKAAIKPNEREKASFLKENILPIEESGKLKFVDQLPGNNSEAGLLAFDIPSIQVRVVNGHTQSMMLPQMNYRNSKLVFMADLLPSQGHIPIPYVMAYDMFPMTTLEEKKSFLDEALANNYVLFFEHDPLIECCRLRATDKGIRAAATFRLDEL